ncbi:hypothetical protein FQZ97_819200 [compost metagenome]
MGVPGLGREDVRQPVVSGDLAGHVQDQAAQAVALVGVGVDAPVALLQVLLHGAFHVHQRVAQGTQPGVLFTVDDVGARGAPVAGLDEDFLDAVLDGFDAGARVARQRGDDGFGQRLRARLVQFPGALAGRRDGLGDLVAVERRDSAVALENVLDMHG